MKRAREIVHYEATNLLGRGVTVVVLDTGIALHRDLTSCIIKFEDFVNEQLFPYDDNGHGTHVAGIIAGKRYGIAPNCNIIALKVLDREGNGNVRESLSAFRWIIENREKFGIRIINISMGMKKGTNVAGEKWLLTGIDLLWQAGLVVIAAAGNRGPQAGSVTVPGIHDKIITVGSADEMYSGRGSKKEKIWKPDLVAPGRDIISCDYKGNGYVKKKGTSMATPIVSGAVALLLSEQPSLTNDEVKRKLLLCCDDLHYPYIRQGMGLLNIRKLLH